MDEYLHSTCMEVDYNIRICHQLIQYLVYCLDGGDVCCAEMALKAVSIVIFMDLTYHRNLLAYF
eukprot:12885152-Ditylum_brightwellii.AAC.2